MRFTIFLIFICLINFGFGQGLVIQENATGFCSVDGVIDSDVGGFTGDGYANGDGEAGTSALWNVDVNEDGEHSLTWRYANGGGSGDLIAEIWVNEEPVLFDYNFKHTGSWTNWTGSDTVSLFLEAGTNKIRLVALSNNGLPNIDYFHILEDGVTTAPCVPSFRFSIDINDPAAGDVSYEPIQPFYDAGTEITLNATSNSGFFFQSWSGRYASDDSTFTFRINAPAHLEALFYPIGTKAEDGVYGYATVQDDHGTPFLMTGGLYGDTVEVNSFGGLKFYLEHEDPYVVTVSQHINSTGQININSNKTLLGITDSSHIEGIRFKINDADNIIIRHLKFSKVVQFDEIEINNAHHIWIDNCDFFTDRDHGSEFYDGLLDIKNASSFITISNTEFHDHFKAILISSGDDSFQDTSIRITFHHNFFHDLGSRTPLLRFGKAHIFNNYFRNTTSGINSRMGACIRVEENYFYKVSLATRTDMSAEVGAFQLIDNIFDASNHVSNPTCVLDVPYEYLSILDDAADIPFIVAGENPVSVLEPESTNGHIVVYPNPVKDRLYLSSKNIESCNVDISLYDINGVQIKKYDDVCLDITPVHLDVGNEHLPNGLYCLKVQIGSNIESIKLVVQR